MSSNMTDYYARRAEEYEQIYQKPERQEELTHLKGFLSRSFAGQNVLEIACGTGYWTQYIAKSASAVTACDYNREVLEIAKSKSYQNCKVDFIEADAYKLQDVPGDHNSGYHGFWWSHIPINRIPAFINAFHAKLLPGARVVMIDNNYVPGSSTVIGRKDKDGNTYQLRTLADGSTYEILKNFPDEKDLREYFAPHSNQIAITRLQYFWTAEYTI